MLLFSVLAAVAIDNAHLLNTNGKCFVFYKTRHNFVFNCMVSNMDFCCWDRQSNHTKRAAWLQLAVPARWRPIQTSEKDFITVRFSFCRHPSADPHFPLVPLSGPSRMLAGKQNKTKKLFYWLQMWHQAIFRSIVCSPPLPVRVSLSQRPALPTDPVPWTIFTRYSRRDGFIIHRLAPQPPPSTHTFPFLSSSSLSPCIRLFHLFIFNPADVPHAWRRLARNTDTVNQGGRGSWGGAELDWEKAPPTPEKKGTCHLSHAAG